MLALEAALKSSVPPLLTKSLVAPAVGVGVVALNSKLYAPPPCQLIGPLLCVSVPTPKAGAMTPPAAMMTGPP